MEDIGDGKRDVYISEAGIVLEACFERDMVRLQYLDGQVILELEKLPDLLEIVKSAHGFMKILKKKG